jgi:hypothetical protein
LAKSCAVQLLLGSADLRAMMVFSSCCSVMTSS